MAINNTCQKPNLVPKGPLALMPKCNDDHFCFFRPVREIEKKKSESFLLYFPSSSVSVITPSLLLGKGLRHLSLQVPPVFSQPLNGQKWSGFIWNSFSHGEKD